MILNYLFCIILFLLSAVTIPDVDVNMIRKSDLDPTQRRPVYCTSYSSQIGPPFNWLFCDVLHPNVMPSAWLTPWKRPVQCAKKTHRKHKRDPSTLRVTHIHSIDAAKSRCLWQNSFIYVAWLIKMCDMTHLYVWQQSFIYATWPIHMCGRLIDMWAMTHLYTVHKLHGRVCHTCKWILEH